ncbi:MAG: RNA polymerase sporulation sigma factor SigH [Defluviitaleaceae bacterium]|nr:RNA polymerase sporulation sigma factor SigH [Defluviitaleaceae bacterium]
MKQGSLHISRLSDEEALRLYREGDDCALDFLIGKYKHLVKLKSRMYFIAGADRDDIVQEGMIGLFKAIRDYKFDQSSFGSFATMCITRQIITAIKAASRQKHMPLNSYVSFFKPAFGADDSDDPQASLLERLSDSRRCDPEELLIGREDKLFIESSMEKILSNLELRVLSLYLSGKSYQEIAGELSRNAKAVENALGRVRRKVSKIIERREGSI